MKKTFLIALGLIGSLVVAESQATASTSDWIGGTADFNNPANWDNGVPGQTDNLNDIGVFTSATPLDISLSINTNLGGLAFMSGASSYTITNLGSNLSLSGTGITNNSGYPLRFVNAGIIQLNNAASSGTTLILLNGHLGPATLIFNNVATASNSTIKSADNTALSPAGTIQFNNASNAGNAIFGKGAGILGSLIIQFNDTSSADNATITAEGKFSGTSTAANATFINQNTSQDFSGQSNAGQATFLNNTAYNFVSFMDSASASSATIINTTGNNFVQFGNSSTAAGATISNSNGTLVFYDSSTAGRAIITNSGAGSDISSSNTCVKGVNILIDPTNLSFCGTSSAAQATIANSNSSITGFGNTATAGNALIFNTGGSSVTFHDLSTASNATITNNDINTGAIFFDTSSAGNAVLHNGGSGNIIQFNNASTAANATISNNGSGLIQFNDISTGGNASIDNSSGTIMVSNLSSSGLTVGSIAGAGSVLLGSKNLIVGVNGLSTEISGIISGTGGSLVKVGTGTLTLSGTNTYTGRTTVAGGKLGISSDSNLGGGSGGLTLSNNSILQTGAGFTSFRPITLASGGGSVDTNGFNSRFSGNIQGSGTFVKAGLGTLTVSGSNTYTGGTLVDGGILRTGSTNALPSSGTIVLANTAGAGLDLNGFNQTIGSLSGGGSSGGKVILGTATLRTGSDNTSSLYAGSIQGSGSLVKIGTGTLVLSGANTFTGDTVVNAGDLNIIAAPSAPGTGSTAGVATLNNLVNNSAVTPGTNGVGSLQVASYSGPGVLDISFNGAQHTSLSVTGNANVSSGTLNVTGSNFKTGQYNVVNAGSLSGTFAMVHAPASSFFLTFSTQYTPTDLEVLINALNFADATQNSNQLAVASALDATKTNAAGDFANAVNALSALTTADQVHNAYNQISGDSVASFQNAGVRSAEVFTHQMNQRAAPMSLAEASYISAPVQLAYAGDLTQSNLGLGEKSQPQSPVPAYGLWSRGLGFVDKSDGNSSIGSPASRATTGGFQVGYDFLLADDVLFGFSGGYAHTSLSVDDRSSSGNSTSLQSGIYASFTPGPWFVNGSMAYTTSSNGMTRPIIFSGINEHASSSFQSRLYTTFVETGYSYKPRQNSSLEPSISLRQSHLHQEAFTESGAPGLDLSVQEQQLDSLVSAVGTRLTHRFRAKSSHPFTLGASAAWQHELGEVNNSITAQFAEAPAGGAFTVQGTPRSRNAAALGLQGRLPLTQTLQAFADYSATLGSGQNTQGLLGGLSLKW